MSYVALNGLGDLGALKNECGPLAAFSREMNKNPQVWDAVGTIFQVLTQALVGSIVLAPLGAQTGAVVLAIAWLRGGCTAEGFSRVVAKQAGDGLGLVLDPIPGLNEPLLSIVGGGALLPVLKPFRNMLRDFGDGKMPRASDAAGLAASSVKAGDIDDGGVSEELARNLGASEESIAKAKQASRSSRSPPKTDRTALARAKEAKARARLAAQERQRVAEFANARAKSASSSSGFPIVPAALVAGVALFLFLRR